MIRFPFIRRTAPDPGAAILRERMDRAVAALEGSHLGRTRGRSARYALPWYLVLGAAGAGKTALVSTAGLKFTLESSPESSPESSIAPWEEAGAPDVAWHFATDAVLLEVSGDRTGPGADPAPWLELVRQVRRRRPRKPLDGVLLAASLEDLARDGGREAAAQGRLARRRLGELERGLGRAVPVHLVCTKMDLLRGFAGFFGELPGGPPAPAWGAVLPGEDGSLPAFVLEFDQLCRGLEQAAAERPGHQAGAAFALEFRALREPLLAFAEALVEPDPYHPRPFLRSFHFASARPGPGLPVSAGAAAAARFGLRLPEPPRDASAAEDRSWFLEGLLREAVFPDRRPDRRSRRLRPGPTRAAAAALLAGFTLLAGAWTWSFAGNRGLARATGDSARAARALSASPALEDRLRALGTLQDALEGLGHRPLGQGWGLRQNRRLERILLAQYDAELARTLLGPVRERLELSLADRRGPGAGQAYDALRTYLMLGRRECMDPALLADRIPHCWESWLQARRRRPEPAMAAMAARASAFYLSRTGDPRLPVIGNSPELVAGARARLRRPAGRATPLDGAYAALRAKADATYEPMTLARILKREDPDLRPGPAIPGSFTREAWEGCFRQAFRDAGADPGPDWVLEGDGSAAGAGGALLEARYRADYARAWGRFLQWLEVRPWAGPEDAAAALGRLADPQATPVKAVLARAAFETGWDNPSGLSRTFASARSKVLERTGRLLGNAGPDGPREPGPGLLGGQFALAGALAEPGPDGRAPIDAYLELLQKARLRLRAVGAGTDPGAAAVQWLQATLAGSGELAEAQQWLDAPRGDPAGWALLRPFLLSPLVQACAALFPLAEQDLDRTWSREVCGPWSGLAGKYPFADSGNEASMADIVRFLKPGDGILSRFVETRLGALVAWEGGAYTSRAWGGRGPRLSSACLRALSQLATASACLGDGGPARFELRPAPTPGLSEILLELDGQKLQYRNGPQDWTGFSWPAPASVQGARIQAVSFRGAGAEVLSAPGRLGLMRLLDQCRIERPGDGEAVLEWRLADAGGGTRVVRFQYRHVGGPDPLGLAALRRHALPARITR